jgi:hypothetical protein
MYDFDVMVITRKGMELLAQATAHNRLIISGCDANASVLDEEEAASVTTRPSTVVSTTTIVNQLCASNTSIFARASYVYPETTGGDVNTFYLYGHLESDPTNNFVICVASDEDSVHLPGSGDLINSYGTEFEIAYAHVGDTVQVVGTANYATLAEHNVLKERTVTTHAEGEPNIGDNQTILGDKFFVQADADKSYVSQLNSLDIFATWIETPALLPLQSFDATGIKSGITQEDCESAIMLVLGCTHETATRIYEQVADTETYGRYRFAPPTSTALATLQSVFDGTVVGLPSVGSVEKPFAIGAFGAVLARDGINIGPVKGTGSVEILYDTTNECVTAGKAASPFKEVHSKSIYAQEEISIGLGNGSTTIAYDSSNGVSAGNINAPFYEAYSKFFHVRSIYANPYDSSDATQIGTGSNPFDYIYGNEIRGSDIVVKSSIDLGYSASSTVFLNIGDYTYIAYGSSPTVSTPLYKVLTCNVTGTGNTTEPLTDGKLVLKKLNGKTHTVDLAGSISQAKVVLGAVSIPIGSIFLANIADNLKSEGSVGEIGEILTISSGQCYVAMKKKMYNQVDTENGKAAPAGNYKLLCQVEFGETSSNLWIKNVLLQRVE